MVLDTAQFARRAAGLIALAILSLPATALAQAEDGDLYQRIEKRLAADPALAAGIGKPAPEMAALGWMTGEWSVTAKVNGDRPAETGKSVVTPLYGGMWLEFRDTYPAGTQDVGYIGFNIVDRRWVSISIDSLGNANIATSKAGWLGNSIVFEGDFLILGEKAHLRQVITRIGPDEYQLENLESMADGTWRSLDTYRYVRRKPG